MTNEIQPYVTLKRVVSYALSELNKSAGDFDDCWILAFRALIDVYGSISSETKTVRLPVAENKTVAFPPDLLQWVKVGILNGNNEIATLKVNRQSTFLKDDSPDRLSALTPDVGLSAVGLNNYYLNYWFNGTPRHLFGTGGGLLQPGSCNVDMKNRVFVLDVNFGYDHLMLEYKSSPEMDDDYQIEIFSQEAVIAFIKWKLRLGSEQEYYNRLKEARRKNRPITLQEINQVIREGQSFKVKG